MVLLKLKFGGTPAGNWAQPDIKHVREVRLVFSAT